MLYFNFQFNGKFPKNFYSSRQNFRHASHLTGFNCKLALNVHKKTNRLLLKFENNRVKNKRTQQTKRETTQTKKKKEKTRERPRRKQKVHSKLLTKITKITKITKKEKKKEKRKRKRKS